MIFSKLLISYFTNIIISIIPCYIGLKAFRTTVSHAIIPEVILLILFFVSLPYHFYSMAVTTDWLIVLGRLDSSPFFYVFIFPVYILTMLFFMELYTASVLLFERYLRRKGAVRLTAFIIEIVIHCFCLLSVFFALSFSPYFNELILRPSSWIYAAIGIKAEHSWSYYIIIFSIYFLLYTGLYNILKFINISTWRKIEAKIYQS